MKGGQVGWGELVPEAYTGSSTLSSLLRALEMCCHPETPRLLEALLAESGFEPQAYRGASPDLAGLGTDDAATAHFLTHGIFERRSFPIDLNLRAVRELARVIARRPDYLTELKAALCHAYAQGLPRDDPAGFAKGAAGLRELRDVGCRPFVLIGDSHSHVFRRSNRCGNAWLTPLHLLCSAGSARSLGNPASRSGYGTQIMRHVQALSPLADIPLLVQFGQVDIEFVTIFRRVQENLHRLDMDYYRRFAEEVVEAYSAFLLQVFGARENLHVLSIFPPALSDDRWAEGYINGHIMGLEGDRDTGAMRDAISRLEIPTLAQRTAIHAYFNDCLKRACRHLGFGYVNVFDGLLSGGTLDLRYVPETRGADHHLDYGATESFATGILFDLAEARRGKP